MSTPSGTKGSSWLRRPQNVWLRRALFQIHLWTGIALGLYILAISVSGSAIVFRNEIYEHADDGPRIVPVRGEPLTEDALKAAVLRTYPGYSVGFIFPGREPNYATEVWMDLDDSRKQRLFDPYTGEDLGPSIPYAIQITSWMMELHTDLLAEDTGRWWNGVASIIMTLTCLTGIVVWWPGLDKWVRSLWVNPRSGWKRINWDLHSAIGFWSFALVFMWAFTGVFLVWPEPFQRQLHKVMPLRQYAPPDLEIDDQVRFAAPPPVLAQQTFDFGKGEFEGKGKGKGRRPQIRRTAGDTVIRWWYWLHFGNFAGWKVKALWTALGLIPALLFVTGTIMWWNRVLSPAARRAKRDARPLPASPAPQP